MGVLVSNNLKALFNTILILLLGVLIALVYCIKLQDDYLENIDFNNEKIINTCEEIIDYCKIEVIEDSSIIILYFKNGIYDVSKINLDSCLGVNFENYKKILIIGSNHLGIGKDY